MSCRLLLADGHWLMRAGLRATLACVAGLQVIGDAADIATAVQLALLLVPDLALIDRALPSAGGIAAVRLIKARAPSQKLLLMVEQDGHGVIRDALQAGCDGLVRKDASDRELLEAIHCVLGGGTYLDADLARQLVLSDARAPVGLGPLAQLSPRERMVFHLIAEGSTNRAAGEHLGLSPKTVEKYRAALMVKLQLRSALELRLLALELGVVQRPTVSPR